MRSVAVINLLVFVVHARAEELVAKSSIQSLDELVERALGKSRLSHKDLDNAMTGKRKTDQSSVEIQQAQAEKSKAEQTGAQFDEGKSLICLSLVCLLVAVVCAWGKRVLVSREPIAEPLLADGPSQTEDGSTPAEFFIGDNRRQNTFEQLNEQLGKIPSRQCTYERGWLDQHVGA